MGGNGLLRRADDRFGQRLKLAGRRARLNDAHDGQLGRLRQLCDCTAGRGCMVNESMLSRDGLAAHVAVDGGAKERAKELLGVSNECKQVIMYDNCQSTRVAHLAGLVAVTSHQAALVDAARG